METISRKIKEFERSAKKSSEYHPEKVTLNIAETFVSVQGEGFYSGTRMLFIRTAGCNVGGACPSGVAPICTLYDGRKFECDTDYNKELSLNLIELNDLIEMSQVDHVCFTGGEPLLHAQLLDRFVKGVLLEERRKYNDAADNSEPPESILTKFHIETSGTKSIPMDLFDNCWVACAPKRGYNPKVLLSADEIKLLVDPDFDIIAARDMVEGTKAARTGHIYLQPVNGVDTVDRHNLGLCLKYQALQPTWKISVQLHKYLEVR